MDTIEPDGIPRRGAEGLEKEDARRVLREREAAPEGLKALDPLLEGLFCAQDVREVDPTLEWKSNLVELMRQGKGLAGLEAIARDLGYTHPAGVRAKAAFSLEKTSERESQTDRRKLGGKHV